MIMTLRFSATIALALICAPSALSFTVPTSVSPTFAGSRVAAPVPATMRHQLSSLRMSETEESSVPRKRRKRKDGKNTEVAQKLSEPEPVVEMIEEVVIVEKAKPVEVKIQDIRDLVSGKAPEVVPEQKVFDDEYDDDDELEDDEEYEYYYEEDEKEFVVGRATTNDNSLEDLLADARKMRESAGPDADKVSIPGAIKEVVSTIVTIDFFVVCGLLLWFVAGIFSSYILKDDTVQIAFNGIFEAIVQPALGILMIGSAAGSLFGTPAEQ